MVASMSLARKRLEVGQSYRSTDGRNEGTIIKVWPVENGSEALILLQCTRNVIRVFIPAEKKQVLPAEKKQVLASAPNP